MSGEDCKSESQTRYEPADIEAISEQILDSLRRSSSAKNDQHDVVSRFWTIYKREAEEYDAEFLKKYNQDLDIVLIFAGLFSAVSTTFIQGMMDDLIPDPNDNTQALLQIVVHTLNSSIFPDQPPELPTWNGPSQVVVWTQSLLYASLCASLLAAFGAVLGKQWLTHYAQVGVRGSIADRCSYRQQKFDGIQKWHFRTIIDLLPFLLQASLGLFGIGIAFHIWNRQHAVGLVIFATIAMGVIFCTILIISSWIWPDCPFKTPMAVTALAMLTHLRNAWVDTLQGFLAWLVIPRKRRLRRTATLRVGQSGPGYKPRGLTTMRPDAMAVSWILVTSTDLSVIGAAAKMVPEIEWPLDLDVFDVFAQLCWAFATVLRQGTNEKRLLSTEDDCLAIGKAALQLFIERKDTDVKFLQRFLSSDLSANLTIDLPVLRTSSEEHRELKFIIQLFRRNIAWQRALPKTGRIPPLVFPHTSNTATPDALIPWISYLIPHIVCGENREDLSLRVSLAQLIISSLRSPELPHKVIADLLLGAGLLMGMVVDPRELRKPDKGDGIESILRRVLNQFYAVLPIDAAATTWNEMGVFALCLFQPVCALIPAFGHVFHEREFPIWCLRLCKHLSTGPHLSSAVPTTDLSPLFERHTDEYGEVSHWYDKFARVVLRISIEAAGQPDISLPPGRRIWRLRYTQAGFASNWVNLALGDGHWWLAFASRYKAKALNGHQDNPPIEYVHAVADAMLVFCEVHRLSEYASDPKLIDLINWSMQADQPAPLRHASLKVVHSLRKSIPSLTSQPRRPTGPDFFAALLSTVIPIPAPEQDNFDDELDNHVAFMEITSAIAQLGDWDDALADHHIPACIGITQNLFKLYSFSISSSDKYFKGLSLMRIWTPAFQIFVQGGWMPEDDAFKLQLWEIILMTFRETLPDYRPTSFSLPLVLSSPLPGPPARLPQRTKSWIEWLEYCRKEVVLQDGIMGNRLAQEIDRQLILACSIHSEQPQPP